MREAEGVDVEEDFEGSRIVFCRVRDCSAGLLAVYEAVYERVR